VQRRASPEHRPRLDSRSLRWVLNPLTQGAITYRCTVRASRASRPAQGDCRTHFNHTTEGRKAVQMLADAYGQRSIVRRPLKKQRAEPSVLYPKRDDVNKVVLASRLVTHTHQLRPAAGVESARPFQFLVCRSQYIRQHIIQSGAIAFPPRSAAKVPFASTTRRARWQKGQRLQCCIRLSRAASGIDPTSFDLHQRHRRRLYRWPSAEACDFPSAVFCTR
jgi:hypothetical protein